MIAGFNLTADHNDQPDQLMPRKTLLGRPVSTGIPPTPKTDRRLIGTWKSDRPATIKEWHFPKKITPELRRWFLKIFGDLSVTYTRTRIRGVFREHRYVQRYELLAVDGDSVAIRYEDTLLFGSWRIQHIHFEGCDRYWIALGCNREWFKRVG
jgi:hypothetical protein